MIWKRTMQMGGLRSRIRCEHATAGDRRGMQLSEQTSVSVESTIIIERKKERELWCFELLRRV